MRRPLLMSATALVMISCQTYDFEPVAPFAVAQTTQSKSIAVKGLKPNLMLLVDQSLSMTIPIVQSAPGCEGCGPNGVGTNCSMSCPTRISELKSAMSSFLSSSAEVARMGLMFFPNSLPPPPGKAPPPCGVPDSTKVALPAVASDDADVTPLLQNAQAINAAISTINPFGGTPTGAALSFLENNQGLDLDDQRDDFVLLLTDGLPNCNASNPINLCSCDTALCGGNCSGQNFCKAQEDRCKCTLAGSLCTSPDGNPPTCRTGCLDQNAVVDRARALRAKGIKVIVVGFGAETGSGDGPTVLNAIADEGGFARTCPNGTNSECGTNNRCLANKVCEKKFYQAADSAELGKVLREIIDEIEPRPCEFNLVTIPKDERYIAVIINGKNVPGGSNTWSYSGNTLTFAEDGVICRDIKASTTTNRVNIEVRVVETL